MKLARMVFVAPLRYCWQMRFLIVLLAFFLTAATADAQTFIGDQYNLTDENGDPVGPGEGSLGHVLSHGFVGCTAAKAQGGACGAGAMAGGISAIAAGEIKGSGATLEEAQEWADEVRLISGIGAALTGADGEAVQIAAGVGESGFRNNYLNHEEALQRAEAILALAECQDGEQSCAPEAIASLEAEILRLNLLDATRDQQYLAACGPSGTSSACAEVSADLDTALGSYRNADLQFTDVFLLPDALFGTLDATDSITGEYQQVVGMRDQLLPQIPWDPEAFGIGTAGGFLIAGGAAATPQLIGCLSNPYCGTQLVASLGDDIAMTGGALGVTVTVTGGVVNRGGQIIGEIVDDGAGVVFRGTTNGFPGSAGTQRAGVTPTSSDPLVAVCYSQNACATFGGDGVVQVIDPKVADEFYEGSLPHDFEIVLDGITPGQAADSAVNVITVDDAIDALNQIGINVPRSTGADGLNTVLQNLRSDGVTPMSPEQVQQFLDLTGSNR